MEKTGISLDEMVSKEGKKLVMAPLRQLNAAGGHLKLQRDESETKETM